MRSSHLLSAAFVALLASSFPLSAQFGPQNQFFCEGPNSAALADVDNDGFADVLVAARSGLAVYRNTNGQGAFSSAITIASEETVCGLVDVDGDGDVDVIGSAEESSGVFLHRNEGALNFALAVDVAPGVSATTIHHADLDADGDQDLFYTTSSGDLMVSYNTDNLGTFAAPVTLASQAMMNAAQATDLNADGILDIVFSSPVVNMLSVCYGLDGFFAPAVEISVAGHGVVCDLDNDGHPDALTGNTMSGMIRWQRNASDGTFLDPTIVDGAFSGPELMTSADLDGDGDQDAVITSSQNGEVAWFENTDGQGTFGPRQTIAFDVPAAAIVTGDADSDGDQDVFVVSSLLNKVVWYTNMANGSGKIMGRVFNDINGDGIFNGTDHGLQGVRVEASDLGATYSNASGMYWFNAVPAGYAVSMPALEDWTFTTADHYAVILPAQGVSQYNDFGVQAAGSVSRLTPDLISAPMRCNEDVFYWATVTNTGNQVGDVLLSLDLDDLTTYSTADIAPTSIANGVVNWLFPNVQPTHERSVRVTVHLPTSDHMGETLHDLLTATQMLNGQPASVTLAPYDPVLLCAMDPNDKLVLPVGEGAEHLTAIGSTLTYTVRFQNTGNASAADVLVLDTLDTDLDASTLKVIASSHTQRTHIQPDGVVRFEFESINLPDSASDRTGSQGYVRFSIQHVVGAPEGTVLNNTADIYFDSNPAVITNTTLNTLTYSLQTGVEEEMMSAGPDMNVFPNPAQGTATVRLSEDLQGRVDLAMFDATGALVRQIVRRSHTVLIDRGELPDGVYLLRAVDERGTARTTRMVFER